MATLGTDPRYRSLATSAAAILGSSSPSIIGAILAQWQCEQPGGPPWPPVHNNPGFVTAGALRSVGITAAAATSSPGVGFLARFASPSEGAAAYAQLLARGARYKDVRTAVAAGDGAKYLERVTAAGYGTRYSCAIGAYRALGGSAAPSTAPTPGTATPATSTPDVRQTLATYLGIPATTVVTETHLRTAADRIASASARTGGSYGRAFPVVLAELRLYLQGHPGITAGAFPIVLSPEGAPPRQDESSDFSLDPFGAIGAAIGEATFTLVVLGAIATLLLMGAWRLTK